MVMGELVVCMRTSLTHVCRCRVGWGRGVMGRRYCWIRTAPCTEHRFWSPPVIDASDCLDWAVGFLSAVVAMGVCASCCVKDSAQERADTAQAYKDLVTRFNSSFDTTADSVYDLATPASKNPNQASNEKKGLLRHSGSSDNLRQTGGHGISPNGYGAVAGASGEGQQPPPTERTKPNRRQVNTAENIGLLGSPASPGMGLMGTTNVTLVSIEYRISDKCVKYVMLLKFSEIPNPGWTVTRRFRQFVELHEAVQQTYPGTLPELPKKRLTKNKSSEVAKKRSAKLKKYVESLLQMDIRSPLLYDFLGIPT